MGAYCTINPQVRSRKTGELVNSKLFADLKKAVGYNNARKVYLHVRSDEFVEEYGSDLAHDENGEFTLNALGGIQELAPFLGIRVRRTEAARQTNAYEPQPASRDSILDAEERSMSYNSKPGNEFVALPEIYQDNSGAEIVQVQLVKNTPENREKAAEISKKKVLLSRLSDMLDRIGVDSGVLDIAMEQLHHDGMSEYDAAVAIAEGLQTAVNRANGSSEQVVLADTIGDIVYVALWNNPLLDRLMTAIERNDLPKYLFSEDELNAMSHAYGEDTAAITEATAIRILSEYLLISPVEDIKSVPELSSISRLLPRLKEVFNGIFSGIDQREITSYVDAAKRSSETRNAPEYEEQEETVIFNQQSETPEYNAAKEAVKKQKKLLHDIIETSVRRYKILSARDTAYDRSFDKDLTANLYAKFEDEEYELGVYEFVEASLEQLAVAESKLQEIMGDSSMPIERKATALKNIKDFIQSYQISLSAIKSAEYAGVIKPNEKMDDLINQASGMIGGLMAAYEEEKNPILVAFVKRFIGEGFEVPFGKEKGKVYTAEEILKMADKDISVFDRWLDSMAESGDLMLRMLDQTAKQARSAARLNTIEYKKKIDAIYLRLKKSGIADTSFMYERNPNGHKTGRYISAEDAERLDTARHKYYEDIMALKKELDAMLPKGATTLHNIIRIRKDYIERLKGQDSIKGVLRETKEALKDKVKRRSDNVETDGSNESQKTVLMDFSGRQVEILPVMFVNSKDGENLDDISEDMTSAMVMYANMACNFSAMNNVVGLLELVREKVTERPVQQRAGAKALVNVLNAFGLSVETKLTKSGDSTKIVQRMNDWFSSQVYSRYMKDEGEILGMDVGMLANLSNEVTALNQFALNILSGISNVMTASAMNRIESICGQYFSVKDLANADITFWKALPEYLADIGQPVKHSKLALFMEKFNTMQDFESDIRGNDYAKSRFSRLMTSNSLYVINNAGELWIQNRAALALGESYGLKDSKGNPISLWDSQQVVTDANGVSRLVTKEGITMANGERFDDNKHVIKFTNKAKSINQRMNGIYNYEDRCAAQAYSWGRMGLMFRKWIKPSLNRRYSSLNYNFDVEEWEEGFYTTTGRFFMQLVRDLKRGQLDIVTSYKHLDPREKANLMRFAIEVGQFISVCAAFAILKDVKKKADDDDDNLAKSWWFNQLLYQTRRLESEIGSQMIINPQMIQEAFNILKSPAACVNTWEGVSNLAQLMVPANYTKTLQTGRYKGHTKAYKLFWDSPFIPMHRTLYRGLHPQNSLQFYDL